MLKLEMVFEELIYTDAIQPYLPTLDLKDRQDFVVVFDNQINDTIFNTFMATWLNGQAVDDEFLNDAMEYEEIPLVGGLRLTMGDKVIDPSCCASFNDIRQWAKIYQGEKIGIWLGHDPAPYIIHSENTMTVVSDEDFGDNTDKIFELTFTYQEFNQAFQKIIDDIAVIKQFSKQWANKYLPKELQEPFVEVFAKCIDLNL